MPKPISKPPPKAAPAPPPDPVPTAPVAVLHRANDAPALGRWIDELLALVDRSALSAEDLTDLASAGAGMSVWQRHILLRVLTKGAS